VRQHNREPCGKQLALREIDHETLVESIIIREPLELNAHELVLELTRLGTADARPVSLSRHIFPVRRLPRLHMALLAHPTITGALVSIAITDYVRLRSRIICRMPTVTEAALFGMKRDAPVLHCENVTNTNTATAAIPLELCLIIYPSPRVSLMV